MLRPRAPRFTSLTFSKLRFKHFKTFAWKLLRHDQSGGASFSFLLYEWAEITMRLTFVFSPFLVQKFMVVTRGLLAADLLVSLKSKDKSGGWASPPP